MFLATFKILAKQEIHQVVCDSPDQMRSFGGQRIKRQFASSSSSNFWQLPNVSGNIEKEWLLFRSTIISSAAESCGRKRLKVVGNSEKKTTPCWNQKIKEAIRAKKETLKALLQDRSSSDLQSRPTKARKKTASALKNPRKSHGKSLVVGWIPTIFRLTKYSGRPSASSVT